MNHRSQILCLIVSLVMIAGSRTGSGGIAPASSLKSSAVHRAPPHVSSDRVSVFQERRNIGSAISYQLVIRGGRVIDPATRLDQIANVGISDGRIVVVSRDFLVGDSVIDATGLVVAPGFVDILSAKGGFTPEGQRFKVMDGVTTMLWMHGGPADVAQWYAEMTRSPQIVNYGITVGHTSLRERVGATDRNAPATPSQLHEMLGLADRAITAGALGIGFGLEYEPGASRREVFELFQMAARRGVPCHLHMRYMGASPPLTSIVGLQEAISNAAATGAATQIAHLNSNAGHAMELALAMIEGARERGIDIAADAYPWDAASTDLESAVFDPGWQERMKITYADVAISETGERLTAESFDRYRYDGSPTPVIMYFVPESSTRAAYESRAVMVGSDGRILDGQGHPRGAGTFARFLRKYVREDEVLSLSEAIEKITIMPARRLWHVAPSIRRKGSIRPGSDADIVVFDLNTVRERATYAAPAQYSDGIKYVIVAGAIVVNAGQLVHGVTVGKPIRRADSIAFGNFGRPEDSPAYDVVIRNGRVLDGSGNPWILADVAISDGRIAKLGLVRERGRQEFDASGRYVSPGWIDMMDQSGRALLSNPLAENKLRMGVTTAVGGEGGTPWPADSVDAYFRYLEEHGISINFGSYFSEGQARRALLGASARAPTPLELDSMRRIMETAMRGGALGMSTALIYPPVSYATTEELVEVAKAAAQHGGIYATHVRGEGKELLESIAEAIEIGERARMPIEIFHFKAAYEPGWNRLMKQAGALIDSARARGVDIAADLYPYTAGGTGLEATIPSWAHEGGPDSLKARLRRPDVRARLKRELRTGSSGWWNIIEASGGWTGVVLVNARNDENQRFANRSIAHIASEIGKDPADVAWDLVLAGNGRVTAIYHMMSEQDIETALRFSWTSIGSDGGTALEPGRLDMRDLPHPRSYGTFPRVIKRYVQDKGVLSLPEAIRKMTSWPATRMRFADRGVLREGMWADVVVFDLEHLSDEATYDNPVAFPKGIDLVFVNGRLTINHGVHTGVRAGRSLRGPGYLAPVDK